MKRDVGYLASVDAKGETRVASGRENPSSEGQRFRFLMKRAAIPIVRTPRPSRRPVEPESGTVTGVMVARMDSMVGWVEVKRSAQS